MRHSHVWISISLISFTGISKHILLLETYLKSAIQLLVIWNCLLEGCSMLTLGITEHYKSICYSPNVSLSFIAYHSTIVSSVSQSQHLLHLPIHYMLFIPGFHLPLSSRLCLIEFILVCGFNYLNTLISSMSKYLSQIAFWNTNPCFHVFSKQLYHKFNVFKTESALPPFCSSFCELDHCLPIQLNVEMWNYPYSIISLITFIYSPAPVEFIFNPSYIKSFFLIPNVTTKFTLTTPLTWIVSLDLPAFAIIPFSIMLHPEVRGFFLKCDVIMSHLKLKFLSEFNPWKKYTVKLAYKIFKSYLI